jgi:glycosyltransferase involved in cell wall biosynthesis
MSGQIDLSLSISRYTMEMFLSWSGCPHSRVKVLPNAIETGKYIPMEKPQQLVEKYGLQDRRVLLTVSRIVSSNRYKGHDKIIELLPALREHFSDLVYLLVGDGDDIGHLRELAASHGVEPYVVFAGKVPDEDIVKFYNLSDAFAMPSCGEGFGFVFLEAAACGVPVLGGSIDGSWDALREGKLGIAVDPRDPRALFDGLVKVLQNGKQEHPSVEHFSYRRFSAKVDAIMSMYLC